jgi:hypothetical protein
MGSPLAVAVVVARYQENTAWVDALPDSWDVFLYTKSPPKAGEGYYRVLPNTGREAETFARFISEEYHTLSKYACVVFLQGDPRDHLDQAYLRVSDLVDIVPNFRHLGRTVTCDGDGRPDHPGLPVAEVHGALFDCKLDAYHFAAGAQYVVPTSRILNKSRYFWTEMHSLLVGGTVCPWTMERMWPSAFGCS